MKPSDVLQNCSFFNIKTQNLRVGESQLVSLCPYEALRLNVRWNLTSLAYGRSHIMIIGTPLQLIKIMRPF